ncbi:MAG TPA: hypothetical protein VKA15_03585, partial [Isosphaeraceae bacterium]|nr:hypothetical protein [Isosphaeraceae bacterium]
ELKNLTVKDTIQSFAARLPGVGPTINNLGEAITNAGAMSASMYTWLLDAPTQMLKNLSPEDVSKLREILDTKRTSGGDSVREAMDDPMVSVAAKDVLKSWINGPLRFATEEELIAGNLRPVETLGGRVGMYAYSGRNAKKVLGALGLRKTAEKMAVRSIARLAPHVDRLDALNTMLGKARADFKDQLTTTRQEVFNDPALNKPLTRELPKTTRRRRAAPISRVELVQAVVGEGGIADRFLEAVAKGDDPVLIGELAKAMRERLSAWNPKSIKAEELRAKTPALGKLYDTAVAFEGWSKAAKGEFDQIDKEIMGEEKAQEHFYNEKMAEHAQWRQTLKDRQNRQRDELLSSYQLAKRKRMGKLGQTIADAEQRRLWYIQSVRTSGDADARRATTDVLHSEIMPTVHRREREFNAETRRQIREATQRLNVDNRQAWTEYQRDQAKMTNRFNKETADLRKRMNTEKVGLGQALREARAYGQAIRNFHETVADNPADQYSDVQLALVQKHLKEMERNTALSIATDRWLKDKKGLTDAEIAKKRADSQVISELVQSHFHQILNQPDLDPELAKEALDEWGAYNHDAQEELKLLIGQGLRIQYIPSATAFDESLGRDSMAPLIGHGVPKPDMAKERSWQLTPRKEDFALGINKAVVQALHRDSTIYLAEHQLKPMALTQDQVDSFVLRNPRLEERLSGGNIPHEELHITAKDLGLVKFDPYALFGFSFPRWGKDNLYLPKSIVDALSSYEKVRTSRVAKGLGTSNKVFRYSILGLSPRYTAHVVFGGTMMLALRSNPLVFTMIPQAVRDLRDGVIPRQALGHTTEMGFEEPVNLVLNETQKEMGRDSVRVAVGEHIEVVQKVKMAAAKPVHVLRAIGDINFRMVHYIRDLQGALAYLDGASKATRRDGKVEIEDPETGKMITVSSDRAVKEGIHHVQQVYGNLNRMSPFERQLAQSVMPFYGWQKHILGYVMSFPFDHPWRALILSQLAFNASQAVPLSWPIRIQLLFQLGAPDAQGNVSAIDVRSLDPFRDVANYASWTGVFEALNPAITAIPSIPFGKDFSFGSSQLYPGVTYNAFYGIETSTSGGSWINALEQFIPQAAAVQSAAQAAGGYRTEWQTNKTSAIKSLLESLNIPFVTPPINLKQISAKAEDARFETAKTAAANAFQTGDFSGLGGYKTVPNPLNTAYEITPAQLEALYKTAQQAQPGVAPIESLLPPPTPYGY